MGLTLYETESSARAIFEQANEILGYDLAKICFEGPAEKLNSTVCSQPALYVTSLAALSKLKRSQPDLLDEVKLTAGLSLGEYTAIVFAGGLSFEDGLRLVQRRGEAMQAAADLAPSGMVSVLGLDAGAVEKVCHAARVEGEVLQVANLLCPGNIVVSGHQVSCNNVAKHAEAAGAMRAVPLAVAGAFHTPLMEPALERLKKALDDATFTQPRIPIISNVDAQPHTDPDELKDLLHQQVCSPVMWEESMRIMINDGINEFYEVGAGRVLCGLMKRIDRKVNCQAISD